MTPGLALALLLGICATPPARAQHHGLTAQTNTGSGTGTGTTSAPQDAPAISEPEWNKKFDQLPPEIERPSYAAYASLSPEGRAGFEARFKDFNPTVTVERLEDADVRGALTRVKDSVASLNSLLSTQPIRRIADGDTATGTVDPAVPQRQPDTNVATNSGTTTQTSTATGSSTEESATPAKKDTTRDVPTPKGEKPVVDKEFRSLLKNGALGALAGAVVGIGLLPLFGPIGIFVGAALGAALMLGAKMLSG